MAANCYLHKNNKKTVQVFVTVFGLWFVSAAAVDVHIRWLHFILGFLSAVCNQNNLSLPSCT